MEITERDFVRMKLTERHLVLYRNTEKILSSQRRLSIQQRIQYVMLASLSAAVSYLFYLKR